MDDSNNKISIIFPTYNGKDFIYKNLKSIQQLSNSNQIEIIIIDNNSIDSSKDLIRSFKDLKINLIEQKLNLGFAKACNIGAKFAKGEYMFITNQDVIFPKDFFKKTIDLYKKLEIINGGDLILCPALVFYDKRINYYGAKIHFLGFSYTVNMYQEIPEKKLTFKTQKISGSSMFLKRKTYLDFKGFDPIFFMYQEDTDMSLRALRNQINIYTTNESILIHQKYRFKLTPFNYYYIERNRYLCLFKNLKNLKNLFPYFILSEIMLLIHAIFTKKIKMRFKIYKFLIQYYRKLRFLRTNLSNCRVPKVKKHQLSSGLDLILFKEFKENNKLFRILLKVINIFF